MAEIVGGELKYIATLDAEQLKQGLTDSEGRLQGFSELITKFGEKTDAVFGQMAENASLQKKFIADLETQYNNLNRVIQDLAKSNSNSHFSDEKKELQELDPLLEQYKKKYEDLRAQIAGMQQDINATAESRRKEVAELQAQSQAYQQTLSDLKKQFEEAVDGKKITTETQKAISTVEEMGSTVKTAVAEIARVNEINFDFGLSKENIAIQKQVIADIQKQIEEIEKRASGMAPGMAHAAVLGELEPLKAELAAEEKALIQLQAELGKTETKYVSLTTERNKALDTMRRLTLEGKEQSDEYKAAEKTMLDYSKAIEQTNAQAKVLSSGGFAGVIQNLSLVTGIFATGQSVIGLFAGENENLNRIMLKTQALMSATITLQQLHTTATNGGVFGITSLTAAKNKWAAVNARVAVSLGITTVAAQVLIATITLGLSVAIAALIVAWDRLSERQAKAAELNNKMAESAAGPIIAYKNLQTQWNALGDDLKAKEQFIKDNADKFEDLGVAVKGVSDAENIFVKNSSSMMAAMMMRARAAAAMQIATDEYKKGLQKQLQFEEDEKVLKTGTLGEKMIVRSNRNVTLLSGESLDGKDNINNANKLVARSVGYTEAEKNLIIKSGVEPFKEIEKQKKQIKKKTKNEVADEYFPPGSVAEIQKRLSAIDESLSKATGSGQIETLKTKRIAVAAELAEAIKKIEIKSIEERAAMQEKYATAYEIISESQGVEAADKMYRPLMEGAQSYYGWLTTEQDKFLQKQKDGGILTDTDKADLVFLTDKINEIQGKKNAFQSFTDGIDEALAKIPTLAGQIEFLQNKATEQLDAKGNKSFDDGEQKYLQEQQDALLAQQKANYQQFLDEHLSFEEQKKAITEKYAELRAQAETPQQVAKVDKAEKSDMSALEMDFLKQSADWQMAFADMEFVSQGALQRIEASLLHFKKVKGATLDPTELRELEEALARVRDAQTSNPFTALIGSMKNLTKAKDEVYFATERYNAAVKYSGRDSDAAIAASKELAEADRKQAESKKEIFRAVQEGQNIFNAVGNGLMDLGDLFGGFDDATNDAIGNIMDIGNAAFDLGKSIATGDVAGMISAGIKLIGSIGKALSGDQKKERDIKKQAVALKQLEDRYNALAFAAERAFGSMKYEGQRDLIKNLEQQKAAIQGMLNTENTKKKKDSEKIAGYQSQIQSINQSIESLKEGIIKDVLQTDVVDAAAKLGDALVDNFGRGEDAIKSMEAVANDMVKNLLKNQLNLMLQNRMKPILDNLLAQAGFNQDGTGTFTGLTPEQIAAFKAQVVAAGQSMEGFLEAYGDIFAGLEDNQQGLKGDIKGITEKTAGALEAQINAIRIYQVEGLNIHRNNQQTFIASLQNLVMIEANTRNLIQIRQDISEMNSKMKKNLVGFP